ncbi:hypothetical protein M9H77_32118 [Catharanthus roseus]|uniref:Uncharacterized protein n=1 Tax=Catharanthus roseus TaxID=4058 RepID=A0ACC0A5W8_CATRO|nr:hypothetical protein M9H77_32118 [Catharanthus roseus]
MHYLWTIVPNLAKEDIHILVEFIQIPQQTVSSTQARNIINMTEHVIVITQMASHKPSMLYTTVNDDDDEIDHLSEDYVASSQSESDDNNDAEEEELQTLVIPVTENISGAFLDMDSGSPIDDLVESSTLRLLDWNDSMIDIQLSMRFVDKCKQ